MFNQTNAVPSLRQLEDGEPSGVCVDDGSAYELVLITLSLPLWTFITVYLLLMLIHYLRRLQYFSLYDRCNPKNAHFRYDFHIVVGRHSTNYSALDSHLILDLLDNQLISAITIQVPGTTIFNDSQLFTFRHSRSALRCVNFSIYRRHPIKDVRSVRVAHSCNNTDSRLFIYGVNLYDSTNGESKFFPITSVVKYRGTQWALNTTFEPKGELTFAKLGCDCLDPFGTSSWPSYMDILILLFYVWCSVFCFGHLMSVRAILGSVALHAFTVTFISATSAAIIALVYLKMIKTHVVDMHYESFIWMVVRTTIVLVVLALSLAFWALATRQMQSCLKEATDWLISSATSGSVSSVILLLTYFIMRRNKLKGDQAILEENDGALMKTNSKPGMEFVYDLGYLRKENQSPVGQFHSPTAKKVPHSKSSKATRRSGSTSRNTPKVGHKKTTSAGNNKQEQANNPGRENKNGDKNDETLDNAFTNSGYMKTRNRNSISQYI